MKLGNSFLYLGIMLVFVFCPSCSKQQDQTQKAAAGNAHSPALSAEQKELMALLPENNAIPGWTRGEEIRFFEPNNLFEYIDGAAENFLNYGFQQVVTVEYNNPQKPSQVVLEIYRMRDPRNAFGVYASERNPDSDYKPIGTEGYIGGTALNFWSGPYYVKLTVFQESEDLKQDMTELAEHVSRKIGVGQSVPPEIDSFPKAGQVPHSIRYLAKDVLGQTYFKEGFEATYRKGNTESKIVIAAPGDETAAKDALARYRQFTATGGKVLREITSPGDGGFLGKDSYYGNMAAIRSGNRIIIALGGPSTDYALSQAAACLRRK